MKPAEAWKRLRDRWKHKKDHEWIERLDEFDIGSAVEQMPMLPHVAAVPWDLRVALRTNAADLIAGRWSLFGWRLTDVGAPPCWHRDATSGVIVEPDGESYLLDYRSLPEGADSRTIWEVNRWSQLTRLAMHGWVDRNASAFDTVQSWLDDWCDRNPVGRGINWTSSLEAALRLMNFVWIDALISAGGSDAARTRQQRLVRRIVPAHALWIRRYLSVGSSANNHLLGELTGLLHGIKRWPSLEKYVGSSSDTWDQIADCILTQFAPDGGNLEQALHYHLFAYELAWHARRLMVVHRPDVTERLKAASEFFARMLHPAEPWDYGDSDNAETIPLCQSRETAPAEWQAWIAGASDKSALHFWLGPSPLRGQFSDERWWLAQQSGMAVGESSGWLIRVDASPLGFGSIAAHGHCDAMHVSIWDGMSALVIDPGTGGYHGFAAKRATLASWAAHNGPMPKSGFMSPKRLGTFLWSRHHAKPLLKKHNNDTLAVEFKHEGHTLNRSVEVTNDGAVVVCDECLEQTELEVRWSFAPECKVEQTESNRWLIKRQALRWLLTVSGPEMSTHTEEVIASRRYAQVEQTQCIVITARQQIESRWTRL